ncbi:MAG TPA: asparagine synthase (glutamine-hydrolyzing), partial [Cytophagaceae bacterium]|nr:asparagine synthase (glutamine-hydrolyzing) [Cytophagaceae bacterium]
KESRPDENFIGKMNAATIHRGPDATSFKKYKQAKASIFIGANRLKVIDLKDDANQPFVSADQRYILAYNGEIYNYKELRKTLESKFTFRTSSDTEVLLHLLISEGVEGLKKVNGMFAFVFYDQQEGKAIIARDPSGIKPLYYYEDEKYFIASSEIKGILATGLVKKELNSEQVEHYLRFKFAEKPKTFYKGIWELEEGRCLECWVLGAECRVKSYIKKPDIISSDVEENKFFLKTEEILVEAVQRQLLADVPAGLFLSGGVDSTLLLAIIHEVGIKGFPSFSIANSKQDKSFGTEDYHFARLAAKKYQSDLHQIEITSSVLHQFDDFIARMDQPIADGASLLTYILSRYSSKHVKVMLSGAGADEVFGGYNRHIAYNRYLKFRNRGLINVVQKFGRILPAGFNHPFRKQFRLLNKFTSQVDQDPEKTFSNFCSSEYFNDDFFGVRSIEIKSNQEQDIDYYLNLALQHDKSEYLISDVLNMTDSMSMQNSLEVRVPFLDSLLLTQVDKVKPSFLLKYGRKWMLQRMLTKRDGEEFCHRKKEGFGMPLGKWLREKDGGGLIERLKNKNNILYNFISHDKVLGIIKAHQSRKRDLSAELWSLSVLAAWLEKEFKL